MRHIIPISGKDSLATAIVQREREPHLPYELFFNDVGSELPETYEWLGRVEKSLSLPVHRIGKSLEDLIFFKGILPSASKRFCTLDTKIKPMEEWIGEQSAMVYFGIRADEERPGYRSSGDADITPVYPLKDKGIGLQEVYRIVQVSGLQPPKFFWKSVHDGVVCLMEKLRRRSFGLSPPVSETIASLPPHVFDALFAWRSRSNCYFCFFQRLYEWVGLLEHHPRLFDRAEQIERSIGNDEQRKPYYWNSAYSLSSIRKNAERIKRKRITQIVREIRTKRISLTVMDALSVAGCGLFCGK